MRFGHRGNLAGFSDAARVTDIRLNDVDGAFAKHVEKQVTSKQAFAGCDWNPKRGDGAVDFRERRRVFRWDGLFKPARPIWREPAAEIDRCVCRKPAVHLDEELGIRADRRSNGSDDLD